jgi:hypothetical protein
MKIRKLFSEFLSWLRQHGKRDAMFTPLTVIHYKVTRQISPLTTLYTGYTQLFIFGVRVAKIQRTRPWDGDE